MAALRESLVPSAAQLRRRTVIATLASIPVALARAQAPGASEDAFTVRDIAVERSGTATIQAREGALADAQLRAAETVFARLVPSAELARMPRLSSAQAARLTRGIEIQEERFAADRWSGVVTVQLDQDAVRDHLQRVGVAAAPRSDAAADGRRLQAEVPIGGLGEWLTIRQRLSEVVAISAVDTLAMSPTRVVVEIQHRGDDTALRAAMRQRGLELRREGATWRISLATTGNP